MIARQAENPKVQFRGSLVLQACQPIPGLDESLREQILGRRGIVDDAQDQGIRGLTVAIVESAHGLRVAAPNATDEVGIVPSENQRRKGRWGRGGGQSWIITTAEGRR